MTLYVASFLIFLATAAALVASKARSDHGSGRCGGCTARQKADCSSTEPRDVR